MSRRDRGASSVTCAEVLGEEGVEGSVLVAGGDLSVILAEVADQGATATPWQRYAYDGVDATPWPPEGPFDAAALRLPKGKDALRMYCILLTRRLTDDGVLYVHGANDEGIRSTGKVLSTWFDEVDTVSSRRHTRVWRAAGRRGMPEPLQATQVTATVVGVELSWASYPGLFAHGHLDPATEALLKKLPPLEGRVLDFGCGAGVISQFVQRRDGITPEGVDVDALAIEAFRANVLDATTHLRDGLPPDTGRYRFIVSNPPLHRGKDIEPGPVRALIDAAPRRLGRSGELWITTQGAMPIRGHLQDRFRLVDQVWRDRRFAVWRAAR